jgi:3-oxoacyl-[acyl-carrier protein] reductase
MDLGVSSKTALVLGASSGLGFAIAESLAGEGAQVVLSARRGERLDRALASVQRVRASAAALPIDLQDAAALGAVERAVREIRPDIVVCNSGGPPAGGALESDLSLWRGQFEVMVVNQIRIIRAAIPHMQKAKWGRILIIASSGVIAPIPNLAISNALRSALVSFAKTLAPELAPHGITVNTIVPGRIATPRVAQLDQIAAERQKTDVASVQDKSAQTIPLGRYGDPREFAAVAAFLVSERASYVTGHMTRVDGGFIRSI